MTTDPNDTRPTAHRLTVTPETLRQAEALGFEPGSVDVLLWALREVDRLRILGPDTESRVLVEARAIASDMLQPAVSSWRAHAATLLAERDAARRDLARIVKLCRDAVDHLEVTAIQPYGALADRLRAEAGVRLSSFRPAGLICGVVVRERVSGNVITRTLCPLPPGHDGDHAEALAGNDTDTDRSAP